MGACRGEGCAEGTVNPSPSWLKSMAAVAALLWLALAKCVRFTHKKAYARGWTVLSRRANVRNAPTPCGFSLRSSCGGDAPCDSREHAERIRVRCPTSFHEGSRRASHCLHAWRGVTVWLTVRGGAGPPIAA
eukprot:SAG11_NODE_9804_length_879_cov_1.648718_1_plen_132_part_00